MQQIRPLNWHLDLLVYEYFEITFKITCANVYMSLILMRVYYLLKIVLNSRKFENQYSMFLKM